VSRIVALVSPRACAIAHVLTRAMNGANILDTHGRVPRMVIVHRFDTAICPFSFELLVK